MTHSSDSASGSLAIFHAIHGCWLVKHIEPNSARYPRLAPLPELLTWPVRACSGGRQRGRAGPHAPRYPAGSSSCRLSVVELLLGREA